MNQTGAEVIRAEATLAETMRDRADAIMKAPAQVNTFIKLSSARRFYESAAESFIIAGRWKDAARAYGQCGRCEKTIGKDLIAATYFFDGGDCAERADHSLAVYLYVQAVAGYVMNGRFPAAASIQRRIALIHSDNGALAEAARAWAYAAELFLGGDDIPQAAIHFYEGGKYYCLAKRFSEASTCFERAASISEEHNIMRLKRPLMIMDAALSLMGLGEISSAEVMLLRISLNDHVFRTSRENKFMKDIISCAKLVDIHGFMDHIWNYDHVCELQPHQLKVFERMYTMFQSELEDKAMRIHKEAEQLKRFGQKKMVIAK
jgi:tetratricopeptide (TPR) repeat protein